MPKLFLLSHREFQYTAWSIQADLSARDHDVFLFFGDEPSERFEADILPLVSKADYLLMIATPYTFQATYQVTNQTRRIIETALSSQRPIIPLVFSDENFISPAYQRFIHKSVRGILQADALRTSVMDWEAAIKTLNRRLIPPSESSSGEFHGSSLSGLDTKALETGRKAEAIYERGNQLYLAGDYQAAKAMFDEAIALLPDYVSAYNNRALAWRRLGDMSGAIADISEVIRLKPDSAFAYINRAAFYNDLKRYQDAIEDTTQALKINPEIAIAYHNRAQSLQALGQKEEALHDYNQAIRLESNVSVSYANRARLYEEMNLPLKAINDYKHAIELDKGSADLYRRRAKLLSQNGMQKEALEDYQEAIGLASTNKLLAILYGDRGNVYYAMKEYALAESDYRIAAGIEPTNVTYRLNLATVNKELHRYQQALDIYETLMVSAPDKSTVYYGMAGAYLGLEAFEQALEAIEQAIEFSNEQKAEYIKLRTEINRARSAYAASVIDLSKVTGVAPKRQGDPLLLAVEQELDDALMEHGFILKKYDSTLNMLSSIMLYQSKDYWIRIVMDRGRVSLDLGSNSSPAANNLYFSFHYVLDFLQASYQWDYSGTPLEQVRSIAQAIIPYWDEIFSQDLLVSKAEVLRQYIDKRQREYWDTR